MAKSKPILKTDKHIALPMPRQAFPYKILLNWTLKTFKNQLKKGENMTYISPMETKPQECPLVDSSSPG